MQKTTTLFCCYLFLCVYFFGYSQKEDVFYKEWKATTDTITSLDKKLKISHTYLPKVTAENRIYTYDQMAFWFNDKQQIDSANFYIDKAIRLEKDFSKSPAIAEAYIAKATVLMSQDEVSKAKEPMQKARKILLNDKNSPIWQTYFQQMGVFHDDSNDYEKAIQYSDSAIQYSLRQKDTLNTANMYHNLGIQYYNQNKLELAVESLLKAISIKEKYKSGDTANSYYILAVFYNNNAMFDNANRYISKSIRKAKEQKENPILLRNYMILAKQYVYRKDKEKALIYNDSAMVLAEELNMKSIIVQLLNNKGDTYFKLSKDTIKGEEYYTKAYNASKSSTMAHYIHLTNIERLIALGFSRKNYTKVKKYLREYKQIIDLKKDVDHEQIWHREMGRFHDQTRNFKKAVYHYKKSYSLYDSVNKVDVKEKVAALEKKFDTKKKELQIAKLNEEKAIQNQKIIKAASQQKILIFSILGIIAFLLLGAVFYQNLKNKKQHLDVANKELEELNTVKNRLFSIISHDLRGMIIPFQRAGKVMNHYVKKGDLEKTKQLSNEIEANSEKLSSTLDNLLNWSLQEMSGYSYTEETFAIETELQEIIQSFSYHAKLKNIQLLLEAHKNEQILFDKGGFHVIFRNLLSNAIKFTENGSIKITIQRNLNVLHFSVVDTGIGIEKDELKKLFTLDEYNSKIGTRGEKGTGLGLHLVHKFVTMLNGKIKVSSELRLGSKFDVYFTVNEETIKSNSSKTLTA